MQLCLSLLKPLLLICGFLNKKYLFRSNASAKSAGKFSIMFLLNFMLAVRG